MRATRLPHNGESAGGSQWPSTAGSACGPTLDDGEGEFEHVEESVPYEVTTAIGSQPFTPIAAAERGLMSALT